MRREKHVSLWVWAEGGSGVRQKVTSRFRRLACQNLNHCARQRLRRTSSVHGVVMTLSLTEEGDRKTLAVANIARKCLVSEISLITLELVMQTKVADKLARFISSIATECGL